ncbi:MAG: sel1 repeat family protein [Deltaproteobacteria bacterium]|nr:sel1 repeat family protein [Deltaproteobacteria bacterium]
MIRVCVPQGFPIFVVAVLLCCCHASGCAPRPADAVAASPRASDTRGPPQPLVVQVRADNAPVLTRECDAGKARSCTWLGRLYGDGVGVPLDAGRSCALYRRACDGADLRGCDLLGGCYQVGVVLPQDLPKAMDLYRRACEGGVANACTSLSLAFGSGSGTRKDESEAARLARKGAQLDQAGCDGGVAEDCTSLASDYLSGMGVPSDLARAAALAERTCGVGHAYGCMVLAMIASESHNEQQKLHALERACERGLLLGCAALGGIYLRGQKEQQVQGLRLVTSACEQGLGAACTMAGDVLCGEGSCAGDVASIAHRLYTKGCAAGESESCDGLKRLGPPPAPR